MSTDDISNQFGDAKLLAMTRDLHDLHHDQWMPATSAAADEWCQVTRSSGPTPSSSSHKSTKGLPVRTVTDLRVASVASSLENLGVCAYQTGIKTATAGKLGKIPAAVPVFALTAMSQQDDHGGACSTRPSLYYVLGQTPASRAPPTTSTRAARPWPLARPP